MSICFEKASEVTCGCGRRTVDYGLWVVGWRAGGLGVVVRGRAGGRLLLPFTLFPIRSTLLFSLTLSPPRLRSPDFSSSSSCSLLLTRLNSLLSSHLISSSPSSSSSFPLPRKRHIPSLCCGSSSFSRPSFPPPSLPSFPNPVRPPRHTHFALPSSQPPLFSSSSLSCWPVQGISR